MRQITKCGNTFIFGPSGAYMTRWEPPKPDDAEDFVERGELWYLPVEEAVGRYGAEVTK